MNRTRSIPFTALLSVFAVLTAFPPAAFSQPPATMDDGGSAGAQIRFTYENPQLEPAKYVVLVNEDGTGRYSSELGAAPASDDDHFPARGQNRAIRVSETTRNAMFSAARSSKYFSISCETKGSHIAFQGRKTLEYSGSGGQGSCTYNWSSNKQIQSVTDIFEAISLTLEEGAKLQVEYEHSRLALDPEFELLDQMAHDGQAREIGNIAPILEKIAGDGAVLRRVQRRAQELLDMAKAE